MATSVRKFLLPAITKNPSFVGEDIVKDVYIPIIDPESCSKIHLECEPSIVQFQKFTSGIVYNQNVRVRNISSTIQRIYVSTPMTRWFSVKVNKEHNLLPGLHLPILLKFKPDEERYYYDTIKISTQSGEYLYIPIHAFSILPSVNFPCQVELPQTVIGQTSTMSIPVSCISPVDLKFYLDILPSLSCSLIQPMKGILNSEKPLELSLMFKPQFAGSFQQKLKLTVTNIELKTLTCKIIYHDLTNKKTKNFLSRSIESKPLPTLFKRTLTADPKTNRKENLLKQGIEDGSKISPKSDSQQSFSTTCQIKTNSRQMKEKQFLDELKRLQDEARNIQIKWQMKLGTTPISYDARQHILAQRELDWEKFREKEMLVDKDALSRTKVKGCTKRPLIDVKEPNRNFRLHFNTGNEWPHRILVLKRFIKAVNKVMVRYRANKRLAQIKKFLKPAPVVIHTTKPACKEDDKKFVFKMDSIKPVSKSLFWCSQENDSVLWSGLKPSTIEPLSFGDTYTPEPVPDIKPLLHEVLGYKPFNVYAARTSYIPIPPKPPADPKCGLNKVLEDEKIRLIHLDSLPKVGRHSKEIKPDKIPDKTYYVKVPNGSEVDIDYEVSRPTYRLDNDTTIEEVAENVIACHKFAIPARSYVEYKSIKDDILPQDQEEIESTPINGSGSQESRHTIADETKSNDDAAQLTLIPMTGEDFLKEYLRCDDTASSKR